MDSVRVAKKVINSFYYLLECWTNVISFIGLPLLEIAFGRVVALKASVAGGARILGVSRVAS